MSALVLSMLLLFASSAHAEFGIEPGSFIFGLSTTQAGAHPDLQTHFNLNTYLDENENRKVHGELKDTTVNLPAGFVGSATAVPQCHPAAFASFACPPSSQVGTLDLKVAFGGPELSSGQVPLYNMVPSKGDTAEFGALIVFVPAELVVHVRSDGDYGLTTEMTDASGDLPIAGAGVTLWGVPADHNGGGAPRQALLTNPSVCGELPPATMTARSYQEVDRWASASSNTLDITGCESLPPLEPSIDVKPEVASSGSPSGYDVDLDVPQVENPDGLATPPVKEVGLELPNGTTLSPTAADGLASCSDEQLGIGTRRAPACPDASKVGSAAITTPLLSSPLTGSVYVGEPKPHDRYRLFLAVEGSGVLVRVPGSVSLDPQSGRIKATFQNLPQMQFSHLHVHLKGGPRAVLVNPESCGAATSTVRLTPYGGGSTASADSSFDIGGCTGSGFSPKLQAGAENPVAGVSSPFRLRITREDSEQKLSGLDLTLPPGQLGNLRGVPYCPESALAGISSEEGAAALEIGDPSCPEASRIGSVAVGAGAGANPFFVSGKAYLAGPYKGAPLSVAFVTPALAGPFDLGNVVVRSALRIDPVTAQVQAVSDPLPAILHGVPLDLKDVRVSLDRPGFTVNPTSCKEMQVAGMVTSSAGTAAPVSNRYQLADCATLGFKPKLALKLSGPTHRSAHPALRAVLKARKGDANIGKAVVTLPKTEFLENAHIRTICTRVQYAANSCPKGSIYGYAKAWSPLLDQPLQGPVYLRSSNHQLPDLVASLDGQIHIDLAGRIDSVHQRIRNTFEAVPDAPISKFVLTMQGGKKGLLVNNTELCGAKPRASVAFTGQNGKVSRSNPLVKADCGKK